MVQQGVDFDQTELFEVAEDGLTLRFRVRPGTDDAGIVQEVLYSQYYREARLPLGERSVVIDVGAHIGAFTILAAARGAQVLALEPLPENYALLVENIRLNGLEKRVKAFDVAAWSCAGEQLLRVADDSTGGSGFYYHKETVPRVPVRCVRLDDLMDAEGIAVCDLLKLDCEGSEFEILGALSEAAWQRIGAIVLEYHLFPGRSVEQLQQLLAKQGFLFISQPLDAPRLGYLLAIRSSAAFPAFQPVQVTSAESPATRLPLLGRLWRSLRRPFHSLVVFYINQALSSYNRRQDWTMAYLRLLAQRVAELSDKADADQGG